jgi:fucose permease
MTLGRIGTLFLVMNFAMLVASLVIGLVVDRGGLKVPLAVSAALVAAGLLIIASADHYGSLLSAAACLGFGGGGLNAGTNTLVADLHDDAGQKAAALNLLGVFFGFGALVMPFGVGALTSRFGVPPLLVAAAVLCLGIALFALSLYFPPPKLQQGWPLLNMPRFARMPVVRVVALLLFFESGNEFLLGGYISTFLTRELEAPLAQASYWLAGFWAAIMLGRFVLSRALLRANGHHIVLACALFAVAGSTIVAGASTPAAAGVGAVLTGLALAGIFPSVLGSAGARFSEHSGTVFGILFTVALCGGMIIPWTAGLLAEARGVSSVFVLAAFNFAAVAALSVVARRLR